MFCCSALENILCTAYKPDWEKTELRDTRANLYVDFTALLFQSRAANLNKANHGSEDRKPTDLPGRKRQKRKAPWKDELPKKVPTQTSRGFGGETSKSITTETSQVIPLCDDSSEENSQTTGNKKEPSQGTPQKQEWVCRGKRTGFGHGIWDTLVNSEKSSQTSSLMWRSKYPHNKSQSACNNSDGNHVAETRRASTELLSSFTFSLSAFENSSSLPVPSQSVFQNLLGKGKIYQGNSDLQNQHGNAEERMEQGIPHAPKCMDSNTEQINQTREPLHEREDSVTNSAQHSDEEMDPSQHSDLENSPLHYSDVQSHLDEHIVLDEYTDVNNECGYEGSDGSPAKYSDLESSLGLDLAEAGKC
ncbi:uncharacterized protein LOC128497660 [Spea bombifrons]|uniref:uncharacterized protein LOC128497660 n=1 Tax=Spea bombifrons TaxID=233779 RepID=UPI00234AFE3F|nr:uncharacterized protein LOC128497660 [Spea bombifrons]